MAKSIDELISRKGIIDLSFSLVVKRTEEDGVRDFYPRWVWKAETNDEKHECEWDGFTSYNEAVENLLETL